MGNLQMLLEIGLLIKRKKTKNKKQKTKKQNKTKTKQKPEKKISKLH